MSHFTRVRTTLRDRDTLAAALRACGYPVVEVHDSPQRLSGWGSATAQAEVIVRRADIPGAAIGDFGFARQPDGSYAVVIDSMDSGRNGRDWLPRLTRAYGHAAALRYAADHGYDVVTDEVEQDGTRRLTLRRLA
jgi:CheY-like chemotaxis protein